MEVKDGIVLIVIIIIFNQELNVIDVKNQKI